MSLRIFEQRYMDMAKASLKSGEPFGICLIREGDEVGTPATPEPIGTIAKIEDWDMPQLGILQVRVEGLNRFRILQLDVQPNGLVIAETETIADDASTASAHLAPCAAFLAKVIPAQQFDPDLFQDAYWVSMRLTEILPLGNAIQQKMLSLTDANMRLEVLARFLTDQGLLAATP